MATTDKEVTQIDDAEVSEATSESTNDTEFADIDDDAYHDDDIDNIDDASDGADGDDDDLEARIAKAIADYDSEHAETDADAEKSKGVDVSASETGANTAAEEKHESTADNAELEMYKKVFADADQMAKGGMYESLIDMIAEGMGMSKEDYKASLRGGDAVDGNAGASAADNKGAESTGDIISSLLSYKLEKDTASLKSSGTDFDMHSLDNITEKYMSLRDNGASAQEAYRASNAKANSKDDTKSHIKSTAAKAAGGAGNVMSAAEIKMAKSIFGDISNKEIQRLYKKVTQ